MVCTGALRASCFGSMQYQRRGAMPELTFRLMRGADAPAVAALHAASWRSVYRGILSDAFLDGPVNEDRAQVWDARLQRTDADTNFGIVAESDGALAGFVYVIGNADPRYGTLIDNLHVDPSRRSSGVGPQLLDVAARGIVSHRLDMRVHLWVFAANVRARAFYTRMRGTEVEMIEQPMAECVPATEFRVAWADASSLLLPR